MLKRSTMRRVRASVLAGLCVACPAFADSELATTSSRLADSTLTLEVPGGASAAASYLAIDGTGWTLQEGRDARPAPIRWFSYSNGSFCITRTVRGYPMPEECGRYVFAGDTVEVTLDSGEVVSGHVRAEDPDGLEARALGQAPTRLRGGDAVDALVGNTLLIVPLGARDIAHYAYHLMPNGAGAFLRDDSGTGSDITPVEISNIRWNRDADGRLCIIAAVGVDCFEIAMVGDRVTLRLEGSVLPCIVEQGDTRHLAPAQRAQADVVLAMLTDATLRWVDGKDGQEAGVYLGPDGWGEALGPLPPLSTRSLRWFFRPDLRQLCVFHTRSRAMPRFGPSNCSPVARVDTSTLLLGEGAYTRRMRVSKGKPARP